MLLTVDGIQYNVFLVSLGRSIKVESGKNSGTFISGERFYDAKNSYYQYNMSINPFLTHKEDYEKLYLVFGTPVETHEITLPYGQGELTFNAHVASVSDNCGKLNPPNTIWEGMSVTLESAEAINI